MVTSGIDRNSRRDLDPAVLAFATDVRLELNRRRISRRVLAMKSGVDHTTLCRFLTYGRDIQLSTAVKIARALDLMIGDY